VFYIPASTWLYAVICFRLRFFSVLDERSVGAAFNAYTTTGSFSRSAVNDISGARRDCQHFLV
jgi:hypothetical protein